jgi:hypothetical protein
MPAFPRIICEYSSAFQSGDNATLPATSPLGAWILLALIAPSTSGASRAELSAVLGVDPMTAADAVRHLVAEPHPAVAAALGLWRRKHLVREQFSTWEVSLPDSVERGEEPSQPLLDEWVRRNTKDMIREIPLNVDESTALVFASALATECSWRVPYNVVEAAALGGTFGESGYACLAGSPASQNFIARTSAAGLVAVHENSSTDGISVMSVLAGTTVPASLVHAAAAELLVARSEGRLRNLIVPLVEVPLGAGEAWEVTEKFGLQDTVSAVLPMWRAESAPIDLALAPGFPAGFAAVEAMVKEPSKVEAKQSVFAEYTAAGFRAAAATAISGAKIGVPQKVRVATVRFNRPYAVLASCAKQPGRVSRWDDVPLFSAWVSSTVDA